MQLFLPAKDRERMKGRERERERDSLPSRKDLKVSLTNRFHFTKLTYHSLYEPEINKRNYMQFDFIDAPRDCNSVPKDTST